jgi:hypothetical protein
MAVGLAALGVLSLAAFPGIAPAGEPATSIGPGWILAAGGVAAIGALLTGLLLDRSGSMELTGRALALAIAASVAAATAPRAKLFGTDTELAFLVATLGFTLLASGLLAWFVHGVHRRVRGQAPPVFLWVAVGSLAVSVPVQDAGHLPLLMYTIPLVSLAIELLRGPRGSAEAASA